ncbi:hypothetical protein [Cryobacterium zhongshanensis]|uniref:Uncharacterized protein n=1 Tax=Cryobacterium zhongshanensis TaxID=2928153 RepID=A0AA41QZ74_9MICO|nr:hypothetical protein [Cryobacterium zhongshanensis]MCI4659553.1 hypothetical protein [Cryobacterium zhongshanensis]
MTMSTEIGALVSTAERDRISQVIHEAADLAFRARVQHALALRVGEHGLADLCRSKNAAGITLARWDALCASTRNAASPKEFMAFARVLRVSPRWLAIGGGDDPFEAPPAGWEVFGSHADQPGVQLEFSKRLDEGLMPKWERAIA